MFLARFSSSFSPPPYTTELHLYNLPRLVFLVSTACVFTPGYCWLIHSVEDLLSDVSALFHSFVLDSSLPGDPIDYLLEEVDVCFPKVEGPNFTPYLTHISQDCNPCQWGLHRLPRLPPISMSPLSSLLLVAIKSTTL